MTNREYNLDIAILLLQIASIVYERESRAIYGVLKEVTKLGSGSGSTLTMKGQVSDATNAAQKALDSGKVQSATQLVSNAISGGGTLKDGVAAAIASGTANVTRAGGLAEALFPADHASDIRNAFSGSRSAKGVASHHVNEFKKKGWHKGGKGEDVIREFCERINVGYEPVSELNSSESVSLISLALLPAFMANGDAY